MSSQTKFRTCNLCEALCGLEIEVENNSAISIKGDKLDVFSKGHICPKAVALKDIHEDPDRLKRPIKKLNGEWIEITWEEAIDETARRIYDIQQRYGNDALSVYQGNPSVHNLGTVLFAPNFIRALKTKNRYSATSVDQLAHLLAGEYMFGHVGLVPVPDIDRTQFWLILGGNPMVSNGSLMTAPNVSGRLKSIRKRGGKVVLIDPRRTETADKVDQHLFIKPGTDIYLLLAMINQVFAWGQVDVAHVEPFINKDQLNKIEALVQSYTPEYAASVTGMSATDIIQLTKEFLAAESAVCYGRLGVSAVEHGGLSHWAINVLNIITGNFDVPGGAMFPSPAIDFDKKGSRKRFGRWHSRVRQLPEFGGELPSSTMAEDILTPGEGQIKAMITSCGNPVLSVPNGRRLDKAFAGLEFMVSIDIYLNETTRHADIILPPATGLETPHYGVFFHKLAVRNTSNFSDPVLEKEEGSKFDWEIFSALQKAYEKLALPEDVVKSKSALYNITINQIMDHFFSQGNSGLSLEKLRAHPHGIDLGPLETVMPKRLMTDDKQINLLDPIYEEALNAFAKKEIPKKSLLLIGRRHLRSNNSWLHNSYRMVKGRDRCTMLIHPNDASNYGITNQELVVVKSRVGEVQIKAEVTDEIMEGTISIPHGWGHHREGIKMNVASTHAGVSMNDLVDDLLVDELCGVSVINGVPVEINKIEA